MAMHLFDFPLLRIGDLGESFAFQCVILYLWSMAQVQVCRSVRIPHGRLFLTFSTHISPSVRVQVFTSILVNVLVKERQPNKNQPTYNEQ